MSDQTQIKTPPVGLAVFLLVGPSFIWAAEYIGSGEVILATRTGAILGSVVLWAVILGIFLKFWIGMSGARYTVCTGEGMIDMFARVPGPRHWAVWVTLVVQFLCGIVSIGAIANAAGFFLHSLTGVPPMVCGWGVALFSLLIVWSGKFKILKIVMSALVLVILLGVTYVAVHVFPPLAEILRGLSFSVPEVPAWASAQEGVSNDAWGEMLPLIGWGAGGFASQVWYTYWVLGAGYGAAAGRGYGKPADTAALKNMSGEDAGKIKGWCKVLYTDSSIAMVIGITVTCAFLIAGAGILGPQQVAPEGNDVALTISDIFSSGWGKAGAFLFLLAGSAALISTQMGQLAGWPRLLADSCRICIPRFGKISWKWQFRGFLIMFFLTNMIIVNTFGYKPVALVQAGALLDGLILTPLQTLCVAAGLFITLPRLLSKEAWSVLKPHWIFGVGLAVAFVVFAYFCIFQIPSAIRDLIEKAGF